MQKENQSKGLVVFGWLLILVASALPEITLGLHYPEGPFDRFFLLKGAILAVCLALSLTWPLISRARSLAIALLVLHVASGLFGGIVGSSSWISWISGRGTPFLRFLINNQLVRGGVALSALAMLWALFRSRSRFFLQIGHVDANASKIAWLGISGKSSWIKVGLVLTLFLSVGTLAFLGIGMPHVVHSLTRYASLLPIVLGFAVINALGEEIVYRLAILAPALQFTSWGQAAMMSAVYFGLGHYYGIPSGTLGVFMAAFLGWLACRSIRDTQGVFWAFLMHVVQDVWIFWFMAVIFSASNGTR